MKKFVVLFLLVIILFNISSCCIPVTPVDYGNSTWVCQELNGYFHVKCSAPEDEIIQVNVDGEFEFNGETYLWKFYFGTAPFVGVNVKTPDIDHWEGYKLKSFDGDFECSSEKLIIYIDKEKDTFFNGEIDTLTFIREVDSNSSASRD